mmetsp:Transcript_20690/g.48375  ORF Transcript_20690/g.48375 Transcript_20690/m.48375 type:complete len:201 (+) Transcript_20690:722-1324(+)
MNSESRDVTSSRMAYTYDSSSLRLSCVSWIQRSCAAMSNSASLSLRSTSLSSPASALPLILSSCLRIFFFITVSFLGSAGAGAAAGAAASTGGASGRSVSSLGAAASGAAASAGAAAAGAGAAAAAGAALASFLGSTTTSSSTSYSCTAQACSMDRMPCGSRRTFTFTLAGVPSSVGGMSEIVKWQINGLTPSDSAAGSA